ncbi:hypothetical protein FD723_33860 (plasmid) [Nostoc sp. C052]|uniref:hypothetical protein n=1 Tax=Nostoc sp. C052 TaxID=2576902 RepID=UPI0015C386A6|nr:hypothetical protein [Nostoc sp. C052]QLE45299.1 hypothetical protein FD723_33860 [Nostoc sp. C052]
MQKLRFLPSIITALTALTLTSCSTTTAEQYEATALTSYTWQAKYANNLKLTLGVNDNSVEKAEPVSK